MSAGPKRSVDPSPLPFESDLTGAARFAAWCERFIKVPSGTGARGPLLLQDWQVDLAASWLDVDPAPRTVGIMAPRGSGKSTFLSAYGLFDFMEGGEAATVVVAAVDERQARLIWNGARRMVELDEDLSARVQVFADRLYVPARDATFQVLPAEPKRLEGLNYSTCLLDEGGVVSRDTFEVLSLAQGKRMSSRLIVIGTPGPNPWDSVLADIEQSVKLHPEDTSTVWREFSARGFEDHPPDCWHCIEMANPALDSFLHRDAIKALMPPKTRESTWRRARLCQYVTESTGGFLPVGTWDDLSTGQGIPDGAEVVVALDGSFSDDTTALVIGTVAEEPHFDLLGAWAPTDGERVPIIEVEDAIRAAGKRYVIRQLVADPFRWARSLQILADEGITTVEFPWSPSRVTAATSDLYSAAVNGRMSHSGNPTLAAHVAAAVLREDARGVRIDKSSRQARALKVDACAALLMCHSRCVWAATNRPKKRRLRTYRR